MHCEPVHIYLLYFNSTVLNDYVMAIVRIVQKSRLYLSLRSTCSRNLVLVSHSLRWRAVHPTQFPFPNVIIPLANEFGICYPLQPNFPTDEFLVSDY